MAQRLNSVRTYVVLSFFFAIAGGFGLAGHLSSVLALGFTVRQSFPALVQAHGHLQILGWVGLLLMGLSLTIIPRLLSTPLKTNPLYIAIIVSTGLLLRSLSQILLPYFNYKILSLSFFLGVILECLGIAAYLLLLTGNFRIKKNLKTPAISRLLPYLFCTLTGWLIFIALNFYSGWQAYKINSYLVPVNLKLLQTDIFFYMTLLPGSLVFSVKLLPLFLGLREPRWPVAMAGSIISIGAILKTASLFFSDSYLDLIANLILFFAIIYFCWQLDLLRLHTPERLQSQIKDNSLRGRGMLPDHGEHGRFELHIYSAFVWLLIGLLFALLKNFNLAITTDAIRHIFLVGFISNLIFGVGLRMLPGMLKKRICAPKLVYLGFALLNFAALGRILPMLINPSDFQFVFKWAFATSGSLGLIAISLMAFNILKGDSTYSRKNIGAANM